MQGAGTPMRRRIILWIMVAAIMTLIVALSLSGLAGLSGVELAGGDIWSG